MYPQFSQRIQQDLNVLKRVRTMFLQDEDALRWWDIERLLRGISFLDPWDQSNVVSKVFWWELQRYIDRENSQNIFQHILESWQSIENIDELWIRFPLSMLLVRNMWWEKWLYLWLENYLKRFILHYDSDAKFPEIQTSQGSSSQTIYGLYVFMEHLQIYKALILNLDRLSQEEKLLVSWAIESIDYSRTKQDVFNVFQNQDIRSLYEENEIDTFIIPTEQEFNDSTLFRYTAQIEDIEDRRVYKPELTSKQVLPYTLLAALYLQSILAMLGWASNLVGRTISASSSPVKEVASEVIIVTTKISKTLGNIPIISLKRRYEIFKKDMAMHAEFKEIRKQKRIVKKQRISYLKSQILSNEKENKYKKWDYTDWDYLITSDKWIIKKWPIWSILRDLLSNELLNDWVERLANERYDTYEAKSIRIDADWIITELTEDEVTDLKGKIRNILSNNSDVTFKDNELSAMAAE
jgi:hypothetical protein